MWHGNMMEWGGAGFFGLGHLLWWVLIIVGVLVLVRWLRRDASSSGAASEDRALSILKERYARARLGFGFEGVIELVRQRHRPMPTRRHRITTPVRAVSGAHAVWR